MRTAIAQVNTAVVVIIGPAESGAAGIGVITGSCAVYWVVETDPCDVICPGVIGTVQQTASGSIVGVGLRVAGCLPGTVLDAGSVVVLPEIGGRTDIHA